MAWLAEKVAAKRKIGIKNIENGFGGAQNRRVKLSSVYGTTVSGVGEGAPHEKHDRGSLIL